MSYDADRRLLTTTGPAPFSGGPALVQTTSSYDPDGHVIAVTRANGASQVVTRASYTATGEVQTVTDPNGNVTTSAYDADDRLASITDPLFRQTVYGYDALSRRTSISNPAISAAPLQQQSYTPDGLVASLADANGNTTSFTQTNNHVGWEIETDELRPAGKPAPGFLLADRTAVKVRRLPPAKAGGRAVSVRPRSRRGEKTSKGRLLIACQRVGRTKPRVRRTDDRRRKPWLVP